MLAIDGAIDAGVGCWRMMLAKELAMAKQESASMLVVNINEQQ